MTPSEPPRSDWLTSCDEALAAGRQPTVPSPALTSDLEILRLLDQLRPPPVAADDTPTRYVLRALHGAGGVGQVWLAHDSDLDRDVALKLLRPERAADPALGDRFLAEARITSRLQHPGIVPVYDVIPADEGQPAFYTMRLVPGRTLAEAVQAYHERRARGIARPVERVDLLSAFVRVGQTIAYAHSRGVIHRDLKPANVALGEFGEVIVLDWGFALEQAEGLPAGEEIVGTPAYMAPEQADGLTALIDARTDVYGLGAMLYEILTGRPPYAGTNSADLLQRVRTEPPPRPGLVARGVPPALEAICRKAMARDPAQRYATANELAREVQQWLSDEPIAAYREGPVGRLLRWCRRHRPAVAGLVTLLVTGLAAFSVSREIVRREQARAADARTAAALERAEERSRAEQALQQRLYFHRIALAERTLTAHNPSRAMQLLDECPGRLRGWEWHCLNRLCRVEPKVLLGHSATVMTAAFHPQDPTTLATCGFDGSIRIWDCVGDRERLRWVGHDGACVYHLAYSPGGTLLATAGWDNTARLWDAMTGTMVRELRGHTRHVIRVGFTSDGAALATLSEDQTLRLWDVATGQERWLSRDASHFAWHLSSMAIDPQRRFIAVGGLDELIRMVSLSDGRSLGQITGQRNVIRDLAFSDDGHWLAVGDGDPGRGTPGEVRVLRVATGETAWTFRGHTDPVHRVAFSPDGKRLASAGYDHAVKLWDLESGQEALTLHAHGDVVRAVAFSPDGRRLVSAGADRGVRVWDSGSADDQPTRERQIITGHTDRVFAVVWVPGAHRVASVSGDFSVRLWEPGRADPLQVYHEPGTYGDYFAIAADPRSRWLVTATSDGLVKYLDREARGIPWLQSGHLGGPIKGLAFSPDGRKLATASWDRTVRIWAVPEGPPPAGTPQRHGVADGGPAKMVFEGHTEPVLSVAWSPDGRWLASASADQSVRIWDAETGAERRLLLGHVSGVHGVAISPDGRRIASAGHDQTVRVWDAATGDEIAVLRGHLSAVTCIAFSPDGRWIASAGDDWRVRLWRADTFASGDVLRGHTDRVHGLAFASDSMTLATASYDRTIRLWDLAGLGE